MKWMWSTAVVAVVLSSVASAQSGKDMGRSANGGTMTTTYTGCVEAVNHGGTFLLTGAADHMSAMADMSMKKNDMPMKEDMPTKQDMPMKEDMPMKHGDMSSAVILTGSSDLKKHVGHKVSVTGSLSKGSDDTMRHDLGTLTVRSLKVVAKSCS